MTITHAQIKLKPCPFCGGMGHFQFDDTHVAPYGHSVTCDSCAASSGSYRSVTRAAESWNTRALESRATPAPVAVDEAARALIAALDNSFWGNSMGGILAGRNRLVAALGKPAPVAVDEAKCIWVENDDGINEGTCGVMWEFIAGGVLDNMVNFCPQCGKSVAIGQGAKVGEVIPTPAEPPSDGSVDPGVGET
jgi:Lar family restriction alleviation protein